MSSAAFLRAYKRLLAERRHARGGCKGADVPDEAGSDEWPADPLRHTRLSVERDVLFDVAREHRPRVFEAGRVIGPAAQPRMGEIIERHGETLTRLSVEGHAYDWTHEPAANETFPRMGETRLRAGIYDLAGQLYDLLHPETYRVGTEGARALSDSLLLVFNGLHRRAFDAEATETTLEQGALGRVVAQLRENVARAQLPASVASTADVRDDLLGKAQHIATRNSVADVLPRMVFRPQQGASGAHSATLALAGDSQAWLRVIVSNLLADELGRKGRCTAPREHGDDERPAREVFRDDRAAEHAFAEQRYGRGLRIYYQTVTGMQDLPELNERPTQVAAPRRAGPEPPDLWFRVWLDRDYHGANWPEILWKWGDLAAARERRGAPDASPLPPPTKSYGGLKAAVDAARTTATPDALAHAAKLALDNVPARLQPTWLDDVSSPNPAQAFWDATEVLRRAMATRQPLQEPLDRWLRALLERDRATNWLESRYSSRNNDKDVRWIDRELYSRIEDVAGPAVRRLRDELAEAGPIGRLLNYYAHAAMRSAPSLAPPQRFVLDEALLAGGFVRALPTRQRADVVRAIRLLYDLDTWMDGRTNHAARGALETMVGEPLWRHTDGELARSKKRIWPKRPARELKSLFSGSAAGSQLDDEDLRDLRRVALRAPLTFEVGRYERENYELLDDETGDFLRDVERASQTRRVEELEGNELLSFVLENIESWRAALDESRQLVAREARDEATRRVTVAVMDAIGHREVPDRDSRANSEGR